MNEEELREPEPRGLWDVHYSYDVLAEGNRQTCPPMHAILVALTMEDAMQQVKDAWVGTKMRFIVATMGQMMTGDKEGETMGQIMDVKFMKVEFKGELTDLVRQVARTQED